jgi:hypothetical protein
MLLPGFILASSDVTCLRHGNADRAQPMAQVPGETTDAHHHGENPQRSPASSDLPTTPDCCQAMAMCAVINALECVASVVPAKVIHGAVVAFTATPPLSRIETPDPPPPKA